MENTKQYRGVTVIISDHWEFFAVDLDGDTQTFDAYREATAAIDAYLAKNATAAKEKLALAAIDSDGVSVTITGVHAGHGRVTRTPPGDKHGSPILYADTPQVRALVAKKVALKAELERIGDTLDGVRVKGEVKDRYDEAVDVPVFYARLKKQYAEAMAVAQALGGEAQ